MTAAIELPTCIPLEFYREFGYPFPNPIALDAWGQMTGRLNPVTGVWTCKGTAGDEAVGTDAGADADTDELPPDGQGATVPAALAPLDWLKANPLVAGLLAFGVLKLVRGRR